MDFTDIGTKATEAATADAVARAMQAQGPSLAATGYCRNPACGDECETRFCCASCRNAWDNIQRINRINGRL